MHDREFLSVKGTRPSRTTGRRCEFGFARVPVPQEINGLRWRSHLVARSGGKEAMGLSHSFLGSTAISALRVGDVVLAFDPRADKGRGALLPHRVTRLYRSTTADWIRLRWHDGTAREGGTTPGLHLPAVLGGLPTTQELACTGSAAVPGPERSGTGHGRAEPLLCRHGTCGRAGDEAWAQGAGTVRARTVWKLAESHGPVNFRSPDVGGVVLGTNRV